MKQIILRIFISAVFIGLLFYLMRGDIPEIAHALRHIDRTLFLSSMAVFLATAPVLAKRLEIIFKAEGAPVTFRESCQLTFVGYFFNNFLPTSVGGDIVKALCAARVTRHPVKSVTSVLMDRIFGLFTFIVIPSISLLFYLREMSNPAVPILVYSFLGVSVFCFFLLFNRSLARHFRFVETALNFFHLGEKVRKIYDGLHGFKDRRWVIAKAMALSVAAQTMSIVALYLIARALGTAVPIVYFFLLVPVVHLISMLPSLNGLGIREGAYIYFLGPYIGRENAAALGVLWLGFLFLASIIGGMVYLLRHDYHIRFKEAVT